MILRCQRFFFFFFFFFSFGGGGGGIFAANLNTVCKIRKLVTKAGLGPRFPRFHVFVD